MDEARRARDAFPGGCFSDYEVLGGARIPTRAEVYWDLPDGRFTYFRGPVTTLELG